MQSHRLPRPQRNRPAEHGSPNPQLAQFDCPKVNGKLVVPIANKLNRPERCRREEWQLCGRSSFGIKSEARLGRKIVLSGESQRNGPEDDLPGIM